MRGLRTDHTAQVIIAGHAFIQNLRRGHYEIAVEIPTAKASGDSIHRTRPNDLTRAEARRGREPRSDNATAPSHGNGPTPHCGSFSGRAVQTGPARRAPFVQGDCR
jgi:hypothetical protein